jgi:hypothetical protein
MAFEKKQNMEDFVAMILLSEIKRCLQIPVTVHAGW